MIRGVIVLGRYKCIQLFYSLRNCCFRWQTSRDGIGDSGLSIGEQLEWVGPKLVGDLFSLNPFIHDGCVYIDTKGFSHPSICIWIPTWYFPMYIAILHGITYIPWDINCFLNATIHHISIFGFIIIALTHLCLNQQSLHKIGTYCS